jgi:hypothetical protein
MKNIFISAVRFGAIVVLTFSVFAGEAFAAPVLTPSTATAISDTTATLIGKVANPGYKNTTVWFEWGDTPNPTTVTGMRDIFSEGFFQGYLSDLKPGTTYYFRAVAIEGGVTAYSPVIAFTTRGGTGSVSTVSSVQGISVSQNAAGTQSTAKENSATSKTVATQKISDTKNDNTAAMATVGNTAGVFPGTLTGWVALLIGLLIIFLIVAMILDSVEERRKAREEAKKKKLEREKETE